MTRLKETDVARPVVELLNAEGWEVYQEVEHCGRRIDIVGKRGPVLWAIEVKARLGFKVIDQAHDWLGEAHMVSIAVPWSRSMHDALPLIRPLGIGVISVNGEARQIVAPKLSRRVAVTSRWTRALAEMLCEEQRTICEAGSARGGHWTPFKNTCGMLLAVVREFPGITMKGAMDELKGKHHYSCDSTARSSLVYWIRAGKVKGIEVDDDRPMRLWPDGYDRSKGPTAVPDKPVDDLPLFGGATP